MRLRLTLRNSIRETSIPLNYQYFLSSAIYHWIEASSPQYATFLHNQGWVLHGTEKRFKHFCFSQLNVSKRRIDAGRLYILSSPIEWYIGLPVEESLKHVVVGIFEKKQFFIEHEQNIFTIDSVEILPDPQWERAMKFRMLSATTVSVPELREGKFIARYLFHNDTHLGDSLRQNILNKYSSLFGATPEDTIFKCTLDRKFINDMEQRGKKLSKLITIKQGRTDETSVRGFMCPITLEGNPELIKLAYESGLGEKGSMGFGMLEAFKM